MDGPIDKSHRDDDLEQHLNENYTFVAVYVEFNNI